MDELSAQRLFKVPDYIDQIQLRSGTQYVVHASAILATLEDCRRERASLLGCYNVHLSHLGTLSAPE